MKSFSIQLFQQKYNIIYHKFLYVRSLTNYVSWIKYFSWTYYGFEALMVNQWKYLNCEKYNSMETINCNKENELILSSYGFQYLWRNIIILFIMILLITLFAYIR